MSEEPTGRRLRRLGRPGHPLLRVVVTWLVSAVGADARRRAAARRRREGLRQRVRAAARDRARQRAAVAAGDPAAAADHRAHARPRRAGPQRRWSCWRSRPRPGLHGRLARRRRSSWPSSSRSSPPRSRRCSRSTTTTSTTATSSSGRRGAAGARSRPTCPGCCSSRSTASRTTCSARAIRDGNAPTLAALDARRLARLTAGRPTGRRRPAPARRACCTATTTTCPRSAGGRRTATRRSSPTSQGRDGARAPRTPNGRGLLFADGASRANILSGDAPHSLLTMSTVLRRDRDGAHRPGLLRLLRQPLQRHAHDRRCSIREIVSELRSAAEQRRQDVQPRIKRGFVYSIMRAWATVIQLDLQVQAVDRATCTRGGRSPTRRSWPTTRSPTTPASSVPRRSPPCARRPPDPPDRRGGRRTPRGPYRLVVLSDHGQSQGATFLDRYGITLEELVARRRRGRDASRPQTADERGARLPGRVADRGVRAAPRPARAVRASDGAQTVDGAVRSAQDDGGRCRASEDAPPELVVMASGCLGLISFPREPGTGDARATCTSATRASSPRCATIPASASCSFAARQHGAIVIGAQRHPLPRRGSRRGRGPARAVRPERRRQVKRTDGFPHCPDIVVNSTYWEEIEEVAAFEELVGSHGGMGGPQSFPFVLHPRDLDLPDQELLGAEAVHAQLRRWLVQLGQHEYADESGNVRVRARP